MARFYALIKGNRGAATRMGTPASGITGHIRGWNVGVRVEMGVDEDGQDVVRVYATGGSHDPGSTQLVAKVKAGLNGPLITRSVQPVPIEPPRLAKSKKGRKK